MDVTMAQRVQPGDLVTYNRAQHQVVAVIADGLWAPYFMLDDEDVISHQLVEEATSEQAVALPRRRAVS